MLNKNKVERSISKCEAKLLSFSNVIAGTNTSISIMVKKKILKEEAIKLEQSWKYLKIGRVGAFEHGLIVVLAVFS